MKQKEIFLLALAVLFVAACSDSRPADSDSGIIPCMTEKDCPAGMYCNDGICDFYKDGSSGCRSDADCPSGKKCEVLSGRCVDVADGGEEERFANAARVRK
jgi:Cys-rich repeat protein